MQSRSLIMTVKDLVKKLAPDLPSDTRIMGAFMDGNETIQSAENHLVIVLVSNEFDTSTPLTI